MRRRRAQEGDLKPQADRLVREVHKFSGEEIIAEALAGIEYDIFDEYPTDYICTCTRERYLTALAGLSDGDLDSMRDGKPIETVCQFCGKAYSFTMDEIDRTRTERRQKKDEV